MFRPRPVRPTATGAVLAVAALVLAGCSTDRAADVPTTDNKSTSAGSTCEGAIPDLPDLTPTAAKAGTKDVTTDFGEGRLPMRPKSALGMYSTDVDILIWLRFPLAKNQPIRGEDVKTFPCFFPQRELKGIKPFVNYPEFDYEASLAAQPDFILNGVGSVQKADERLPDIAPTYTVDTWDGTPWVEDFEATAKALGRTRYYEDWKAIYDRRVAEVKNEIGDVEGRVVVPATYWDGKIETGCKGGVECQVFSDLGLTIAPISLSKDGGGEDLSGEQLGQLEDVDYGFMIKNPTQAGQDQFDKEIADLETNELWRDLEFVKKDQIVTYERDMSFGSPSGQLAFLEVVADALAR